MLTRFAAPFLVLGFLAFGCSSSRVNSTGAAGAAGTTVSGGGTTGTGGQASLDAQAAESGSDSPGSGGEGGAVDGGNDVHADSANDALAPCDPSQAFGAAVLVAGVNGQTGEDWIARLSDDEINIFFTSNRSGNHDLYSATRPTPRDAFGAPVAIMALNSNMADGALSLTADGLTAFIESNRTGPYKVFVSVRATSLAVFSTPSVVAGINSTSDEGQPAVLPDGSALYFDSSRSGNHDLYRAGRNSSTGGFDAPVLVSTIATPQDEDWPTPTSDELTLYFSSTRSDAGARGGQDIWMTKRPSRTAAFEPPVNVQELNTPANESPSWISPDGCRLYFFRGAPPKIYVAERAR